MSQLGATPSTLTAALDRIDHDLPQASTHAELLKEAMQLEVTLGNYVDNFIDSNGTPTLPLHNDDELSRLAGGFERSWNQRLLNQGTRSITLRIFLAHFLAARIDPLGDTRSTLLPPEILQTYQAATAGETTSRKYFILAAIAWKTSTDESSSAVCNRQCGIDAAHVEGDDGLSCCRPISPQQNPFDILRSTVPHHRAGSETYTRCAFPVPF